MSDALPTTPQSADQVTGIDVLEMRISKDEQRVYYKLQSTWSSGKTTDKNGVIDPPKFAAAVASFTKPGPVKLFLQWLVANGFETNITPQ